ncbi:MAG TPA: OsmC family peroxiredoxin [Pyrinomonadaceae bacterium]|nr:OsmC family peroxiredoxin [Acidobacteriota bacterium]HQZ94845.1 OsmC family peroxiredoxin [Pyrinomonadaceae bacterium]
MADRKANASWTGSLTEGNGTVALGSGSFEGSFSFGTRFGEDPGTNPEELLGASLAGCYAMALNATLEKGGTPASSVKSEAVVHLGKDDSGFVIKGIDLSVEAAVEGLDDAAFQAVAETVSKACPISKALAATKITLHAKLV